MNLGIYIPNFFWLPELHVKNYCWTSAQRSDAKQRDDEQPSPNSWTPSTHHFISGHQEFALLCVCLSIVVSPCRHRCTKPLANKSKGVSFVTPPCFSWPLPSWFSCGWRRWPLDLRNSITQQHLLKNWLWKERNKNCGRCDDGGCGCTRIFSNSLMERQPCNSFMWAQPSL